MKAAKIGDSWGWAQEREFACAIVVRATYCVSATESEHNH